MKSWFIVIFISNMYKQEQFNLVNDLEFEVYNIHGALFKKEDIEYLQITFPGGLYSLDKLIKTTVNTMVQDLSDVNHIRKEFAISGAMRWPWSQEAPILSIFPENVSKFFVP